MAPGSSAKVFVPVPWCTASADIDECAQGMECPENSTCTNTVGSYVCSCLDSEQGEYGLPGRHGPRPHHPQALWKRIPRGPRLVGEKGSWLSSVSKHLLSLAEGTRVQPPLMFPGCQSH